MKNVYKICDLKPLKNKRTFIIADEDIYIDKIEIDVKNKDKILEIIEEHLIELFDDISDIIFQMEKININKKSFMFLYCFKCRNNELIQAISKGNLKLLPVQFYIHKKYKKKLNNENCVMIFEDNDSLYVNFTKDKKIFDSSILRDFKKDILNKILVEIEDFVGNKKNIFFIEKNKKINRYNFHEFYSKLNINRIEA